MTSGRPIFAIIAGPNGAGKSTGASVLLPRGMVFLNADEIAKALTGYPSLDTDMQASRILLGRMAQLHKLGCSLAVETTLASRSLAAKVRLFQASGYRFRLIFGFLPDPLLAIRRVAMRVRLGGHDIPEETIRRRYQAGLINLLGIYLPIADEWTVFDASLPLPIIPIAAGGRTLETKVEQPGLWDLLQRRARS